MMTPRALLTVGLFFLAGPAACGPRPHSEGVPDLVLERIIPLNGVAGRIDHLAVDIQGKRLFVAELGNGSVEAIDFTRGASLGRISGLKTPQGVAYLPARDEVVVANGGDGSVRFYRSADLAPEGMIAVGPDADNLRVDTSGRVVAGFGGGALAVINPVNKTVGAKLLLPAHPEGFWLDGDRVFVNLPDARRIIVGDLGAGRILASWPAAPLWNFPMAEDATTGSLAIVYRIPPRLQLRDAATGAVTLSRSTCGDADDVMIDTFRHRIYVICGDGVVDVFDQRRGDRLFRINTRPGARTGVFVPAWDRLIVAARAGHDKAALLVFRPQP